MTSVSTQIEEGVGGVQMNLKSFSLVFQLSAKEENLLLIV